MSAAHRSPRSHRLGAVAVLTALVGALAAAPAQAAEQCDGLVDSGADYTREVLCAGESDSPTTLTLTRDITFSADDYGYYTGTQDLTIDGAGYTASLAEGVGDTKHPHFLVADGVANAPHITVKNITVTGFDRGDWTINAPYVAGLTIVNATFENNGTTGEINTGVINSLGDTTIANSTFSGNRGSALRVYPDGGAQPTLTVSGSTFTGNVAVSSLVSVTGELNVAQSTFSHNVTDDYIVYVNNYTKTSPRITNSTFAYNTTVVGAVRIAGGDSAVIAHSTFAHNTGTGYGGSPHAADVEANVGTHLVGSVFTGAKGSPSCVANNPRKLYFKADYTFFSDDSCATVEPGEGNIVNGGDPMLGNLANSGGRTSTMTPAKNSPLLNKVPVAATGLKVDQRGLPRPSGSASDIGAVEVQPPAPQPVNLVDISNNPSSRHYTQFYRHITWLANAGITKGWHIGGGKYEFRAKQEITREAMAAFMYRSAGSPAVNLPAKSPFKDVTPRNTNFYKEIVWMNQQGISTGWNVTGGKEFRPKDAITRDAMAAFMYRFAGKPPFTPPSKSPFTDMSRDTQFYKEITWLADTGISTGWNVGSGRYEYRPYDQISREAMAAFLYRFDAL